MPAAGVPFKTPVAAVKVRPLGNVPDSLRLAVGKPLSMTVKLPAAPEKLAKLADPHDEKAPLEDRARAYLHANCSHCHRKWGGGNAEFQLLSTLPVKELGVLDVKPAPANDTRGPSGGVPP